MPERVFGFRVLVGVPAFVACALESAGDGWFVHGFVLWSSSVERRFVLYRTLPASPAPHQLRLPYRNTRVVSSARGEVSLCAACRCVQSCGPCCRESRVSCDSRARVAFRRRVVCVVCTPIEYTLHRASSTGRAGWYARRRGEAVHDTRRRRSCRGTGRAQAVYRESGLGSGSAGAIDVVVDVVWTPPV